jgi:hypothetical protein
MGKAAAPHRVGILLRNGVLVAGCESGRDGSG